MACSAPPSLGLAFAAAFCGICVPAFLLVLAFLVCGKKAEATSKKASTMFGQLKILVAFVQILSSMPGVMGGVPFPASFVSVTLPFTLANLDFVGLLSLSACRLALGFHGQTLVHMSMPPLMLLTIVGAYAAAHCVKKPKDAGERTHRQAEVAKMLILGTLLLCKSAVVSCGCVVMLSC